jgi:hypothetical protein
MAARITFSCSDELKVALESYAEKKGIPISKAVCDALELLLHPPAVPPPVPTPPPPPISDPAALHQLYEQRIYLEALGQHAEHMRQTIEQIVCFSGMPIRFPLPLNIPPWKLH